MWTYGQDPASDLHYTILEATVQGSSFELATAQGKQSFFLPLIGAYNVANAVAALGVALFAVHEEMEKTCQSSQIHSVGSKANNVVDDSR